MNRLHTELHRLYLLPSPDEGDGDGTSARGGCLVGASRNVRALVMELTAPPDWEVLSKVWRGVQGDLELPAPAIAVSGIDGLQLWFSVQEPVSVARAAEFLAQLRSRYLPDVAPARLRLLPSATEPPRHAPLVPAQQGVENWSAFVAADLAPVFAETPWLDMPPNAEGQADLLARLKSIKPPAFDAALQRLQPAVPQSPPPPLEAGAPATGAPDVDARRFLQQVLNDETAPLALRIDAAKALLP